MMKVSKIVLASLPVVLAGATLFAQQPTQTQTQAQPRQTQQPGQVLPGQVLPGQVLPGQTNPGQINPGQTNQVQINPGQTNQGQTIQGQTNPGQTNQGQINPAQNNQGQTNQTRSTQNQQGMSQSAMHSTNEMFAACLAIDNQEEIQLAQFAIDKAKDSSVKEFATMLVEEHKSCLDAINKAAPNISQLGTLKDSNSSANRSTGDNSQQNRNQTVSNVTNQPHVGASGSTLDMVQLHREMAEQCLVDSKEALSEKKDGEFDKCFVGMQLAKHAGMKTKLTVLQKHATGDLKNVISDGLEKTKKHMKVAENLWKQLDENDSSNTTRKTE